jgi:HlyD family secretion protein
MRNATFRRILPLILILVGIVVGVVYLYSVSGPEEGPLQASGTVEATEVHVAPEIGGRVVEVLVQEGDPVEAGQVLFRMDDSLLEAQRHSAQAALAAAQAGVETAHAAVESAEVGLDIARTAARAEERLATADDWHLQVPRSDALPAWYFGTTEARQAAEAELEAAEDALSAAQAELQDLLEQLGGQALRAVEARMAQAQQAYLIAAELLGRARLARENQELLDAAEDQFEAAEDELELAREEYDGLLDDEAAEDLLVARANLTLAQARCQTAQSLVDGLRLGEQSLQVQAAMAALEQAQAVEAQAIAAVDQIHAEIAALDLQLAKLEVLSPIEGVVLTRDLEPGAVLQPGSTVLSIGRLDAMRITVYIFETRYGELSLSDRASVTVDSFPETTFEAVVVRIGDQAEFTPRNVQTEEGRRTMVFAVEVSVTDPEGKLKPGMPADVRFELP